VTKICNYHSIEKQIFKVKHSDVDINAAIDVGFGVLELYKGKYAGQKFMFDPLLNDYSFNISLGLKPLLSEDHFNIRLGLYMKAVSTNEVQQWSLS
jgi:hypothetical protein